MLSVGFSPRRCPTEHTNAHLYSGMDQHYPGTVTDCRVLPYPILCSPSLPSFSSSLPSALCPALQSACASGGRRWGEGEEEESSLSPGPRTRWEKAQLFSFALCSWTPEKPAPHGSTSVHSCQSSASEQHNCQFSAIPAKTSQ